MNWLACRTIPADPDSIRWLAQSMANTLSWGIPPASCAAELDAVLESARIVNPTAARRLGCEMRSDPSHWDRDRLIAALQTLVAQVEA